MDILHFETTGYRREDLIQRLQTNSYRSKIHKIHYVATPKVACTTVKWWFAELTGHVERIRNYPNSAESDPDLMIHDCYMKVAPEVTGFHANEIEEVLSDSSYFRFALVRNPFVRIFSAWQSKLLLREPLQTGPYEDKPFFLAKIESFHDIAQAFESFVEHLDVSEAPTIMDVHWMPQTAVLRADLLNYSRIARVESPERLIDDLEARIGASARGLLGSNRFNEGLIVYEPNLITPRAALLIRKIYATDFEDFEYPLTLPEVQETVNGADALAARAIAIVRARHRRLRDMRAAFNHQLHCGTPQS